RAYMRYLVPAMARLFTQGGGSRLLWQYYWDTIDACVPTQAVVDCLRECGFDEVRSRLQLGLFCEYTARKGMKGQGCSLEAPFSRFASPFRLHPLSLCSLLRVLLDHRDDAGIAVVHGLLGGGDAFLIAHGRVGALLQKQFGDFRFVAVGGVPERGTSIVV